MTHLAKSCFYWKASQLTIICETNNNSIKFENRQAYNCKTIFTPYHYYLWLICICFTLKNIFNIKHLICT